MNIEKIRLNTLVFGLAVIFLSSCGNPEKKSDSETENITSTDILQTDSSQTYQHIAIASIKDNKWDEYIAAMHNNISNSRKEAGNILFNMYQPEDGSHKVAFIERFKNNAAFEEHSKADYLPEVVTKESLIGDMDLIELKEVAEVPPVEPAKEVATPRNVIVFFDVKPEKRQTFIDGFKEVTPHSRKAPGNIRFNLFQRADDANRFVLVESWESVAQHESHLGQDYSKKLDEQLEGAFASNPGDTRWLAKDISL